MVIGIDIRMLSRGAKTGIEEYTANLLSNILRLDKDIEFRLFYNGYKKIPLDYEWSKFENVKMMPFAIPNKILDISSRLFNYPKIDRLLGGIDVFFSPHIFLSALSKKCVSVITFHDLSFKIYPEFYSANKNYWHLSMNPKNQAKKANKIIAVSQSTKNDLIKYYAIDPDKIKVIYPGVNLAEETANWESDMSDMKETKKKYKLPDKYILYLGTLEPRKNIIGLIKAYELYRKKLNIQYRISLPTGQAGNIPKLMIAGSKGWLYENIFKQAKNSPVKNDIIFTGFIDEKDKFVVYKLASLFVYPSFYEGFGFPPLEAMSHRVPVITSNFSSLPEAVGNAAIMINPYNLDELSDAMKEVLEDDRLKNALVEKGFEQIKKFSWQKCARETLDVLVSA